MHVFHHVIAQPTHLLPQTSPCIDLIFTDQPNLIVDSDFLLHYMQTSITRLPDSNLISVVKIHLHLSGWFGTTIEQMLKSVNWERMFIIKLFTNRYIFSMKHLCIYFQTLFQINLLNLMINTPLG